MNTTIIHIENLKCHGCASTIKKGISKFDEVSLVEVDVTQSTVSITYNGTEEVVGKFKNKLAGLGYPEAGHNNMISTAKSYVSCAIGRINN